VVAEIIGFLEMELASGVRHPKTLFNLASAYAAQGRHDEALEMLARAVDYGCNFQGLQFVETESGERSLWGIPWGMEWRDLEGDPRYQRQLSRQKALVDHRAANIRALLATHDMDQLLAPVIEAHTVGR
jgi:pentatricopeptide repeat protein